MFPIALFRIGWIRTSNLLRVEGSAIELQFQVVCHVNYVSVCFNLTPTKNLSGITLGGCCSERSLHVPCRAFLDTIRHTFRLFSSRQRIVTTERFELPLHLSEELLYRQPRQTVFALLSGIRYCQSNSYLYDTSNDWLLWGFITSRKLPNSGLLGITLSHNVYYSYKSTTLY